LVKVICLEWVVTRPSNNEELFFFRRSPNVINTFKDKLAGIENYITQKLGVKPKRKERPNDIHELNWEEKNGITVTLEIRNLEGGEIRMVIYKE